MPHRSSLLRFMSAGIAIALLSACGGGDSGEGEQTVAMRDMEVVDGTASDAMTDLDGVQTEGIAIPPAPGASIPAPAAGTSNSAAATDEKSNEDVIADQ